MSVELDNIVCKLESFMDNIKTAKLEAIKEEFYANGYMDAIMDVINGNVEFDKVLAMKHDGKIKTEDYSMYENEFSKMIEHGKDSQDSLKSRHPSIVADNMAKRIAESRARQKRALEK